MCRRWRGKSGQPERLEAYVRRVMINEFLKKRALELLSPRQRVVLVLRFYEELPDAEIASIVRCRQATVRSLAARALSALRIDLAASAAVSPGSTHAEGPS